MTEGKLPRIAIITQFYNNYNLGANLQAYALQTFLLNQGYECNTVNYCESWRSPQAQSIPKLSIRIRKLTIRKIYMIARADFSLFIRKVFITRLIDKENEVRKEFRNTYIRSTPRMIYNELQQNVDQADIYICGSDVIWDPSCLDDGYLLRFVPDERLKIAYAPSCGTCQYTKDDLEHVIPLLRRFNALSCREHQGKEFLEKVTNRDVEWCMDPVFLLSKSEWSFFCSDGPFTREKYVLCYFLGDNRKYRQEIERIARDGHYKIYAIPNWEDVLSNYGWFNSKLLYGLGPIQFINAIFHADYIFTDSFHGCAMSIIMEKQVYAFERSNRGKTSKLNTRLTSLLNLLSIQNRYINSDNCTSESFNTDQINYKITHKLLDKEIVKSKEYLLNSIKIGV